VTRLSHPNGWWRDTAQQLLVLKQDKSVTPSLQAIVRTSANLLGRFHAMWTLEGLGTLDAALVRQAMKDPEPRMRIQAIRASETLYKGGDRSFAADYQTLAKDTSVDVALQAIMTLNTLKVPNAATTIKATMEANKAAGVQLVANAILNPGANAGGRGGFGGRGGPAPFTPEQQQIMQRGGAIYTELCFACHGNDGRGEPLPGAAPGLTRGPSLAGSPRVTGHRDFMIKTLLHGLTGPLDGERYSDLMIPMGSNSDQWVADVASYVRNNFGNSASFIAPSDVARARSSSSGRSTAWTQPELEAAMPRILPSDTTWKVTASHNPTAASGALTFLGWSTQTPQEPGMWFQIELPQAATLAEIQFTAGAGAGRGGRGGGGGGAAGGRAAGAAPGGAPGAPVAPVPAGEPPVVAPGQAARGQGAAAAPGPAAAPQAPAGPEASGFPREYRVQVSQDGTTWSTPVAQGQAAPGAVAIAFAPVQAKFVRITQTATAQPPAFWSMQNLKLLAVPSPSR
jgi:mono/diheme cytochrome c family protein